MGMRQDHIRPRLCSQTASPTARKYSRPSGKNRSDAPLEGSSAKPVVCRLPCHGAAETVRGGRGGRYGLHRGFPTRRSRFGLVTGLRSRLLDRPPRAEPALLPADRAASGGAALLYTLARRSGLLGQPGGADQPAALAGRYTADDGNPNRPSIRPLAVNHHLIARPRCGMRL